MAWTKAKTAAVMSISLLVVVVTTIVVVKTKSVKKGEPTRSKEQQAEQSSGVRAEEKQLEAERIKSRQQTNETVNATTLDLRPYINAKLTEAPLCWKGNNANNLAELPEGKHIYAGVPFDVGGSIQLMGGWWNIIRKPTPHRSAMFASTGVAPNSICCTAMASSLIRILARWFPK